MQIGIHGYNVQIYIYQKKEERNDFTENLALEMVPSYKYLHRFM